MNVYTRPTGFEPVREFPNRFQVYLLNRSDKASIQFTRRLFCVFYKRDMTYYVFLSNNE